MPEPPLLSLCMIVRDDARGLERCIESARTLVDEVVVVDTGSVDDSVAVARRLGARVIETRWNDDFSEARNLGLEHARGRYILFLDADEVLQPPSPRWLRRVLREDAHLGFYFPLVSAEADGEESRVSILRLFRASPEVRFRYPIHEQVLPDLQQWARRTGARFGYLPEITIHHEGYRPEAVRQRGKEERNLRLFAKALLQYPDDLYLRYKHADYLRSCSVPRDQVEDAAAKAIELWTSLSPEQRALVPFAGELMALWTAGLFERGLVETAAEWIVQAPPLLYRSPYYDYVAAAVLYRMGHGAAALEALDRALQPVPPLSMSPIRRHLPELIHCLRARVHLQRSEGAEAEAAAREALRVQPASVAATRLLADALWLQERPAECLRVLSAALKELPQESALLLHLGVCLLRLQRTSTALECLRRAAPREDLARRLLESLEGDRPPAPGDLEQVLTSAARHPGTALLAGR